MVDDTATLLRWAQQRPSPWKNGGGVTREIAVWPPDTTDFDWRVSIADVETDGPFSSYPGIDRVITLLEGPSMRLTSGGRTKDLTPLEPFDFPGEAEIYCALPGGPTRDLNLMLRRTRVRGAIGIHDGRSPVDFPPGPGHRLVVALEDDVCVRAGSDEWTLGRYDAVSAPRGLPLSVREGCTAAFIEVVPRD